MDKIQAAADWRARFQNRTPRSPSAAADVRVVAAGADLTELFIYDEIGPWGITADAFNKALAGVTTPNVTVRINSPGGDVFDGFAIFNALRAHGANVGVVIDGLAASIASVIALAGQTVTMNSPSLMMVHRAWTLALGNANDMRKTAGLLDKVDGELAAVYAAKTGQDAAAMLAMMDAETWLTAEEAAAVGLVDTVADPSKDAAAQAAAKAELEAAHAARMRAARALILGVR
jgi:ATP-dependent protease ClpP protease subunit